MTFIPQPPIDILLHGLVGVDYILHLSAPLAPIADKSSTRFAVQHEIEREERTAGGLMWRVAQALSEANLRVALSGNPFGDDSNGRLVERENQERGWLFSQRVESWETPYWVVLQTPDAPTVVLSRCQAARQHDREEFGDQSSTRFPVWPRARLICCSDELPFSALVLARFARAERIPLHFVSTTNVSTDEQTRAAVEELHSLATNVVALQSDNAKDLATQLRASLRLVEDGSGDRIGAQ
jgi:hypothetical protein